MIRIIALHTKGKVKLVNNSKTNLTWQGVFLGIIIGFLISGIIFTILFNTVNNEKNRLQIALDNIKKNNQSDKNSEANEAEKAVALVISDQAQGVLAAICEMDVKKLATYIHPEKGVRFSPYAYVDQKTNIVLKKEQLTEDVLEKSFPWGNYDGSGAPINLTVRAYFKKFVYDQDYLTVKTIGYNRFIGHGNSINNALEIYPSSIIVEYYFPGTEKYSGMDWGSLRLVFEKYDQSWFLAGIIHDQWTI
jgi:hypothetical protein